MPDLPPLAQFLRSRREQLSPAAAGLTVSGRRRTPGLRREEVATSAGISIDYLIRLEQGRDTNPSPDVIAALAGALQLDRDGRLHLMGLAARAASPHLEDLCPGPPVVDAEVSPTVRSLLDQIRTPALVAGALGDVLATNAAFRAVAEPLGMLAVPHLVRHVFVHPEARTAYADWDAVADAQVARLRAAHRCLDEEAVVADLLAELLAVPSFVERWEAHPMGSDRPRPLALCHPDAGELRFDVEVLDLAGQLDRLIATDVPVSPAQLRVVGDG